MQTTEGNTLSVPRGNTIGNCRVCFKPCDSKYLECFICDPDNKSLCKPICPGCNKSNSNWNFEMFSKCDNCDPSGASYIEPAPYKTKAEVNDNVNSPKHYISHPTGIECITIVQDFNFNVGNAIKYLWRAGLKNPDPIEDLKKAAKYIEFELKRLKDEK